MDDLWRPFVDNRGFVLLDGGLATELERAGYDLNDPLWSGKLLLDAPEAIATVHADYLQAGADVLITATYQATVQGLCERGLSEEKARRLLGLAVELAMEERRKLSMVNCQSSIANEAVKPIVAASVGPYGAYLADGSEYRGDYGLTRRELSDFHRPRWDVLVESSAELLACETIPSLLEAEAILDLLHETPQRQAWFSFSCRDGKHISDGTPIIECGKLLYGEAQVAAVGINCTRPQFVPNLIDELRQVTDKPIIVYPNSGELWDAQAHCWIEGSAESAESFTSQALDWYQRGATIIGGCCRTSPVHIEQIRGALIKTGNRL